MRLFDIFRKKVKIKSANENRIDLEDGGYVLSFYHDGHGNKVDRENAKAVISTVFDSNGNRIQEVYGTLRDKNQKQEEDYDIREYDNSKFPVFKKQIRIKHDKTTVRATDKTPSFDQLQGKYTIYTSGHHISGCEYTEISVGQYEYKYYYVYSQMTDRMNACGYIKQVPESCMVNGKVDSQKLLEYLGTNETKESSINVNNIKSPQSKVSIATNEQSPTIKQTTKAEAIESLRRKIFNVVTINKSTEFKLASLLWSAVANCFPWARNCDGAWFKLDLVTKELFVELSSYDQFGGCNKVPLTTEKFHEIAKKYNFSEELILMNEKKDWEELFDSDLTAAISNAQDFLRREQAQALYEERLKHGIVISDDLKNQKPRMDLFKVRIALYQRYGDRCVEIVQSNGRYHFTTLHGDEKYLSSQEAVWLEKQVNDTLLNPDNSTWQSLYGSDSMYVEIVNQGKGYKMSGGLPKRKYSDLQHLLHKLELYGLQPEKKEEKVLLFIINQDNPIENKHSNIDRWVFIDTNNGTPYFELRDFNDLNSQSITPKDKTIITYDKLLEFAKIHSEKMFNKYSGINQDNWIDYVINMI